MNIFHGIVEGAKKAAQFKSSAEQRLQKIGSDFVKRRSTPESQARIKRLIQYESGKGY